jgi:prepilin-type processing-associated H-X9-DG protein
MLLPALARAKESANRIKCLNGLKQLSTAARLYSDDSQGTLPPRTNQNRWPTLLQPFYANTNLLVCTSDAQRGVPQTDTTSQAAPDRAPRSYLINGWNDYFRTNLVDDDWTLYMAGTYSKAGMKENNILKSSDTVLLGEKKNRTSTGNSGDYFMDLLEGNGNDSDKVEHGCHSNPMRRSQVGGSNFAFCDGSVRYLRYGRSTWPQNLWAVTEEARNYFKFQAP